MKILIKNGTVITMDSNNSNEYEVLDIVIDDNKIVYVGKNYNLECDKVIDATGKVVMPGLVNCHTHLGMSIFRCCNDDYSLDSWLKKKIWPIEDNLTSEDMYYTTLLSCIEMIKTGTTTFNDMYFGYDGVMKAVINTKMRGIVGRCLMGNMDNASIERIDEFKDLYAKYKGNDLIKFSVAVHGLYTCNKDYLKLCNEVADEYKLPIHIHLSENENEVRTVIGSYDKLPVMVLDEVGYLDKQLVLAHGNFISDKELDILDGKDISICTNPVSNLNLGCGICDLVKYKSKGINLCIGTDGVGSGNSLNMFYHISLVDYLQKGIYKEPTVMSSYDVLKMATVNGAKALGYDNIGCIKEGNLADIIILDIDDICLYPVSDLISFVTHNCYFDCVDTTIINGEILMENKKLLLDIDIDNLKNKIKEILNRVGI